MLFNRLGVRDYGGLTIEKKDNCKIMVIIAMEDCALTSHRAQTVLLVRIRCAVSSRMTGHVTQLGSGSCDWINPV